MLTGRSAATGGVGNTLLRRVERWAGWIEQRETVPSQDPLVPAAWRAAAVRASGGLAELNSSGRNRLGH